MPWKPEHAENRRKKERENPEYRAKRIKQGAAKDKASRKQYMKDYAKKNPEKFKRTSEQQAEVNRRRREKYAKDKEYRDSIKKTVADWHEKNPDARKRQRIKKYGLTLDQYRALLDRAGHRCQICGFSEKADRNMFPVIDHSHITGKVRGVLCMNCNMGIGKLRDSVDNLEAAIKYLRNSPNG